MGNSVQYDNNNIAMNQQSTNIYPTNNTTSLFNQPISGSNGFNGSNGTNSNLTNPNLTNSQFDPMLLNGTTLDDDMDFNSTNRTYNLAKQDPILIKSVAREIINGLKENNMSLYDNSSINSYKKNDSEDYVRNEHTKDREKDNYSTSSTKSKNKVNKIAETIEDFVIDTKSSNTYSNYAGWFFDECFNYKDFLILFILYFVLSQEMIKDFFAKYFSSLNYDDEGKIGVQGVIIYGLILTILFMLIKKLF